MPVCDCGSVDFGSVGWRVPSIDRWVDQLLGQSSCGTKCTCARRRPRLARSLITPHTTTARAHLQPFLRQRPSNPRLDHKSVHRVQECGPKGTWDACWIGPVGQGGRWIGLNSALGPGPLSSVVPMIFISRRRAASSYLLATFFWHGRIISPLTLLRTDSHRSQPNQQASSMWSAGGAAVRRTALLRQRPPMKLAPASALGAAAARALVGGGGGLLRQQAGGARRHQSGVYNFPPSAHYDLVRLDLRWAGGKMIGTIESTIRQKDSHSHRPRSQAIHPSHHQPWGSCSSTNQPVP